MRDASLHIKESDLIKVLESIWAHNKILKYDHKDMAKSIIDKAKSYSVSSRSIIVTNDKLYKKTEKLQLANRSNTAMFAQMLLLVRRKFKHRGVQLVKAGEADWLNLKEACKLATEFCDEFSIPIKTGYNEYLTIGMGMMKHFSIFKFKSIHAPICQRYEALLEIQADKQHSETHRAHVIFCKIIGEKIGEVQGYEKIPEKFVYFVRLSSEAKKYGVSVKEYIKAQFEAFEYKNAIPDPAQLVGDKAIQRLQHWAYTNGVKLGKGSGKGIDFKKIKHGKKE